MADWVEDTSTVPEQRHERSVASPLCFVDEELKVRRISNMPEITVVDGS